MKIDCRMFFAGITTEEQANAVARAIATMGAMIAERFGLLGAAHVTIDADGASEDDDAHVQAHAAARSN